MEVMTKTPPQDRDPKLNKVDKRALLMQAVTTSWQKIAPFWPLKNLIAANPLAGLESLPFEDALKEANTLFQQPDIPQPLHDINRESIKWLQAFFDQGQSTIQMPLRRKGLLASTLSLLYFDQYVPQQALSELERMTKLCDDPIVLIKDCLQTLSIATEDHEKFLTLMLTTLPGWAGYVQYRTSWADRQDLQDPHIVTKEAYLAFRLVLTCLFWPAAKDLLSWYQQASAQSNVDAICHKIREQESLYREGLLSELQRQEKSPAQSQIKAQLVFCIDVRSEPFRRRLEARGAYETFGFAGFFGLPIEIENTMTREIYPSCPVLLKPAHKIVESTAIANVKKATLGYARLEGFKKLYQSVKYTFTTPFALVETLGIVTGFSMLFRNMAPNLSVAIKSKLVSSVSPAYPMLSPIDSIPFEQQVALSFGALNTMGLNTDFAPLVVFCGHGSTTVNNAYATALDCGACGGRHGGANARVLASILNEPRVREALALKQIHIPKETVFLAAGHNTTTDRVEIYDSPHHASIHEQLLSLKADLEQVRDENSQWRCAEMGVATTLAQARQKTALRSANWAEVRPEWGLAKNAAFIVGPRWLTEKMDLKGRAFLHSYEWQKDPDGSALTTILTAPMVVAQWINAQYLFSTLDNVAFGGGSKITKNISGKMGVMQGNASDLMNGLPLQSVYATDVMAYHQAMRLTVVVYAPQPMIDPIIEQHTTLQTLFQNGWVHLVCHDPESKRHTSLQRDLTWIPIN